MSTALSLEDVRVFLGGNEILCGVSLDIAPGEFLTLLGPSGSGKTTTLNVIAGLVANSGGHVRFDGEPVDKRPAHDRDIGLVFQSYALFPHMTVGDNVSFPLRTRKVPKAERGPIVERMLELVQLPGIADAQGLLALRRPAAADRAGSRARALAQRAAAGRADGGARQAAAGDDADRAEADPRGGGRDHGRGHPRPDRGDDDVGPGRDHARRPDRAGRHPRAALPGTGDPVRGPVPRRDQPDPGCRRAARGVRLRCRQSEGHGGAAARGLRPRRDQRRRLRLDHGDG